MRDGSEAIRHIEVIIQGYKSLLLCGELSAFGFNIAINFGPSAAICIDKPRRKVGGIKKACNNDGQYCECASEAE